VQLRHAFSSSIMDIATFPSSCRDRNDTRVMAEVLSLQRPSTA